MTGTYAQSGVLALMLSEIRGGGPWHPCCLCKVVLRTFGQAGIALLKGLGEGLGELAQEPGAAGVLPQMALHQPQQAISSQFGSAQPVVPVIQLQHEHQSGLHKHF